MNTQSCQNSPIATQPQTPQSSTIFQTPSKPPTNPPPQLSKLCRCTCSHQTSRTSSPRKQNNNQFGTDRSGEVELFRWMSREGDKGRKESQVWTADSSRHQEDGRRGLAWSMRDGLREYEQEIKELRKWVMVLQKQCNIYQQTITKMSQKIESLQSENTTLSAQLQTASINAQSLQKTHKCQLKQLQQKLQQKQAANKQQIRQLKDRVNVIMSKYGELESDMNTSELQWTVWKEKWIVERRCYVDKIQHLHAIVRDLTDRKNGNKPDGRPRSHFQTNNKSQARRHYEDIISSKSNRSINSSNRNSPTHYYS